MTTRHFLLLILAVLIGFSAAAPLAHAQDYGREEPFARKLPPNAQKAKPAPKKPVRAINRLKDSPGEVSKGSGLLFWVLALMMLGGAIFVITRSNLITAVMGMVGTFFAIAAIYAMLFAHFLTVIQVLVYAGAIMVLFVFVIMILNKPEAEPWRGTGVGGKVVVILAVLYLLFRLVMVLTSIDPPDASYDRPGAVALLSGDEAAFGSTKALGHALFRDYLFPFEAVSLVLLIAIVGAVAVARPHERRPAAIREGTPGAKPSDSSTSGTAGKKS